MATHSSVLAWRIPGTAGPGGLPSMGSHRVGHDWSDLAAAAAVQIIFFSWESLDFRSLRPYRDQALRQDCGSTAGSTNPLLPFVYPKDIQNVYSSHDQKTKKSYWKYHNAWANNEGLWLFAVGTESPLTLWFWNVDLKLWEFYFSFENRHTACPFP